jgi:hypothetical protein
MSRFLGLLLILWLLVSCVPAIQPADGATKGRLTVTTQETFTEYLLESQEPIIFAQFVFIGKVTYDAPEACSLDLDGFHTCTFRGEKTSYAMNIAGEVLGLNVIFKIKDDATPYFLETP